jgi:hypothetical protein
MRPASQEQRHKVQGSGRKVNKLNRFSLCLIPSALCRGIFIAGRLTWIAEG